VSERDTREGKAAGGVAARSRLPSWSPSSP